MLLNGRDYVARYGPKPGDPIVVVEYLAVAPWNDPALTSDWRLRGCGTALLRCAVRLSLAHGGGGRIALFSVPQAEAFYHRLPGVIDRGLDPEHGDLRYFEVEPRLFTPDLVPPSPEETGSGNRL